ncbi:hypothetical protein J5N97_023228 [Dioscorea zingiberensis]|uniref:Uncharacterized protein n=1 Tax=Dioscorea zingiberensis TaxID=325984 RepID=A0A9D5HBB3_9LILI|nr:hypothetical protein J5N97_023228 [Dioscorea zingiberensis]
MLLMYLITFMLFKFISSKQVYDSILCSADGISQAASRYTCDHNSVSSCATFIVYRARNGYDTIPEISRLFGVHKSKLLLHNNLSSNTPSMNLEKNWEVVIPIKCSCLGGFFQSNVSFPVSNGDTYYHIACEVFEGIVKSHALALENQIEEKKFSSKVKLNVPLRCACPDTNDTRDGILYLVTYPIVEFDNLELLAAKFNISSEDIFKANGIGTFSAIFPNTTLLVPLRAKPNINSSITIPNNAGAAPPVILNNEANNSVKEKHFYLARYEVMSFPLIILVFFCLGLYIKRRHKPRDDDDDDAKHISSTSCLYPNLVAGLMSKYSLISYTIEELSEVTNNFSEDTKLGLSTHKGSLKGNIEVVIKKMKYGDACKMINIHSTINHSSIVKLEGVCYGEDDGKSPSYLVFEFASKGCLRDCLKENPSLLPWEKRTQIAFDIAVGLHYIHHCTIPSYTHMNINATNILITSEWRAKIANLGHEMEKEKEKEWIAPEYLQQGLVSTKVDVFAFGVVLFELLMGREMKDESLVKEFSGKVGINGCLEETMREFMDPCLRDYSSINGEALCMSFLAKACVDDDPQHRPSMDDILKILARICSKI